MRELFISLIVVVSLGQFSLLSHSINFFLKCNSNIILLFSLIVLIKNVHILAIFVSFQLNHCASLYYIFSSDLKKKIMKYAKIFSRGREPERLSLIERGPPCLLLIPNSKVVVYLGLAVTAADGEHRPVFSIYFVAFSLLRYFLLLI